MQKKLIAGACLALGMQAAGAQTTLKAGDIAVISFNSHPDDFAWVTLVDLAAGTKLSFSDHSWDANASFRTNEGVTDWTFATAVRAGTVFTAASATPGSTISLSTSGEQLFAFQGSVDKPSLLSGLNFGNAGWVSSGTATASLSYLPTHLATGQSALQLISPSQSAYYTGKTSGTAAELREELFNPARWTSSSASALATTNWASGFTVTAVPEAGHLTMLLAGLSIVSLALRRRA